MDQKQLSTLCENLVISAFAENEERIAKGLAQNLSWDDGWEKTVTRAAYNAAKVSTALSVQIMLDLLLKTGLFKISEEVTRPHLTVLQGGRSHEQPEP